MASTAVSIADKLQAVRSRMAAACERSDREPQAVSLVAVTKYAELDWIHELVKSGCAELAENRPQQLLARVQELPSSVHWHLVGHLQRNKVRLLLPLVALIHSVDSLRLLERIDRVAGELSLRPRVLLEVNAARQASKDGFAPEEVTAGWPALLAFRNVDVVGLMVMAPFVANPEDVRPVFRRLRELRDQLAGQSPESRPLTELSMGMSNDFEVAIEEGATMVRIGSLLFDDLRRA